jgi:hypothetical protein
MEVSGQLHASAALSPGKEPLVLIGQEAGWALRAVLDAVMRKIPNTHWESNSGTSIVQPVARRCTTQLSEMRNSYKTLVGKPEGKGPRESPGPGWEDNIRIDLRKIG